MEYQNVHTLYYHTNKQKASRIKKFYYELNFFILPYFIKNHFFFFKIIYRVTFENGSNSLF